MHNTGRIPLISVWILALASACTAVQSGPPLDIIHPTVPSLARADVKVLLYVEPTLAALRVAYDTPGLGPMYRNTIRHCDILYRGGRFVVQQTAADKKDRSMFDEANESKRSRPWLMADTFVLEDGTTNTGAAQFALNENHDLGVGYKAAALAGLRYALKRVDAAEVNGPEQPRLPKGYDYLVVIAPNPDLQDSIQLCGRIRRTNVAGVTHTANASPNYNYTQGFTAYKSGGGGMQAVHVPGQFMNLGMGDGSYEVTTELRVHGECEFQSGCTVLILDRDGKTIWEKRLTGLGAHRDFSFATETLGKVILPGVRDSLVDLSDHIAVAVSEWASSR